MYLGVLAAGELLCVAARGLEAFLLERAGLLLPDRRTTWLTWEDLTGVWSCSRVVGVISIALPW